jgi:hypothetical protein
MMTTPQAAALAAALLFVLFVVAQALLPAIAFRGRKREAHGRLSTAVARGTDTARPAIERAAALRDAATIALDELKRPRLASRYALWAGDALPGDPETVALASRILMRAKKPRALERFLWRALDASTDPSARDAAFDALIALYEGPMDAPERARVLRRLDAARDSSAPRATAAHAER